MNEWKTFTGRLLWAMNRAGKTNQSELARAVGVKPQSIQYLCHPESNAQGSTHTAALARELRVSADWLATGQGLPASLGQAGNLLREQAPQGYGTGPSLKAPVLGTFRFNAAGDIEPPVASSAQPDGHVQPPIVGANVHAARIKGNALSPYAKDGQYLLIQAGAEPLAAEDILLVTLADGRVLIREFMHQRDGTLVLLPIQGGQPEPIDMTDVAGIDTVICVVSRRWWHGGGA